MTAKADIKRLELAESRAVVLLVKGWRKIEIVRELHIARATLDTWAVRHGGYIKRAKEARLTRLLNPLAAR